MTCESILYNLKSDKNVLTLNLNNWTGKYWGKNDNNN